MNGFRMRGKQISCTVQFRGADDAVVRSHRCTPGSIVPAPIRIRLDAKARPNRRRSRHERHLQRGEIAPGIPWAGNRRNCGVHPCRCGDRHRRHRDCASGRFRPAARRDLHDGRGSLHAHHRRAQLPQFHDPDHVHADRHGGVGIAVERLPCVCGPWRVACGAALWRRGRRGGVAARRALHLPLPQNAARRRHRARHSRWSRRSAF